MTTRRAVLVCTIAVVNLFGTADVASAADEQYEAVSYAQSVSQAQTVAGNSPDEAKNLALNLCQQFASKYPGYKNDCVVAAWVHNGWVMLVGDNANDGQLGGAFGSGWGHTQDGARQEAVGVCKNYGGTQCNDISGAQTPAYDPNQPTTGG